MRTVPFVGWVARMLLLLIIGDDGPRGHRKVPWCQLRPSLERYTALADDGSWETFRSVAAKRPGVISDLTPEIAAWMDEGMFCRWVIGGLPSYDHLLEEANGVLGHRFERDWTLDIRGTAVSASLWSKGPEPLRQGVEVRPEGPRVHATTARMEQHKRVAGACLVVPGPHSVEVDIRAHTSDSPAAQTAAPNRMMSLDRNPPISADRFGVVNRKLNVQMNCSAAPAAPIAASRGHHW